jgi:phosphonoacetaldehyde hydrolase
MIRACIFDLGGTIVDKYSLSPFLSFQKAFKKNNIHIRNTLIQKDMGMEKKAHIEKILFQDPHTLNKWFQEYNKRPERKDIEMIYNDFNMIQNENSKNIDIIPETKKCINHLRDRNILLGCTTGFGRETLDIIGDVLRKDNIYLDSYVSSTCVTESMRRPNSGMIYKNMKNLGLTGTGTTGILKIDDTKVGIEEGKRAGCITVGVARWSTYMDMTPSSFIVNNLELEKRLIKSRKKLLEAKPDYIIDTLDELIPLINHIKLSNI